MLSVGSAANGRVMGRRVMFGLAAQGGNRRLPSGERGRYRRGVGVGQAQRRRGRRERVGHELSSAIDGRGHNRGWQPGSKVSMMIIRPPQQGQGFHPSSACPPSVPSLSLLDEAGSGMPRSWRADAMLVVRLPLAKKP